MKCSKCQAEWTPGSVKSQLLTCPFCGASLISTEAMDENQTMTSVMVRIVEQFGEEILSQERKCLAAFKDFAPKLEKEQKILKLAFGEGIADFFLHCPVAEREAHIQKARQAMNALLSDDASLLVVESFSVALGWDVNEVQRKQDVLVQKERQVPQLKKTSDIKNNDMPSKVVSEDEANKMFQEGESCFVKTQYGDAMKWYRKAADVGNAVAMNNIGFMYQNGLGVTQSYGEAMKWYRKAVDAGNARAMYHIGHIYAEGKGVMQDYGEAMKWYRKAADAGNEKAKKCIQEIQAKDIQAKQYREAADAGDVIAMYNMGHIYAEGKGVIRDYGEAMKWYRKAADAGNTDAMSEMGYMYQFGDASIRDYGEAMKWNCKAADTGSARAMYNIGYMYHNGAGVEQNYNEAMKWYRKAADAGNEKAQMRIREIQAKTGKSFCYITTAVCKRLCKPDDCYELTTFRKFRDNWLMMQPDGKALIREYYEVAPKIVQRIDSLPNAHEIYQDIMTRYLKPCLHMIERKDMEGCKRMYMKMVSELKNA